MIENLPTPVPGKILVKMDIIGTDSLEQGRITSAEVVKIPAYMGTRHEYGNVTGSRVWITGGEILMVEESTTILVVDQNDIVAYRDEDNKGVV